MSKATTITGLSAAGALVAALFWLLPQPQAAGPTDWPEQTGNSFVLRGVRVFDGETVRESVDVSVRKGSIVAVGPRLSVPEGTLELTAAGSTLLPALLDAHTHNFLTSRSDALRFGVGTQIDMFTSAASLAAAREQRESLERVTEADMWSAGTLVTADGGHGTQFGVPIPTLDPGEDAAAFVAARVAEGSDFIKLIVEHGWSTPLPTLDAETVTAVVAAAHAHDKLAVVHVSRLEDARLAIAAGADGLAHLFGDAVADDAFVAAVRRRGAFVVPTLTVLESLANRPHGLLDDGRIRPYLRPEQEATLRRQFPTGGRAAALENALASTRRLYEAGVPILAGSDAPNPGTAHGASLHRELELLVEAGLPPAAALAAATSVPVDRFRIPDRGRIAPGKRADLVLVDGDPLRDITATRAIVAVWENGFRVERQRSDGAPASPAVALEDGALGSFEEGDDGWFPTTDSIRGGSSQVELRVAGGALNVEARVKAGVPWPWAGAMRMLGGGSMEPVDISGFDTLALRLRGSGRVRVLFFSGVSAQGMPQSWPVDLEEGWAEARIPLAEVPGLDRARARAVAVVAGPAPGASGFEIDSVELR